MQHRLLQDLKDYLLDYRDTLPKKYVPGIRRKKTVNSLPEVEVIDLINTLIIRLNQLEDSGTRKNLDEDAELVLEAKILNDFYAAFIKSPQISFEGQVLISVTNLQECLNQSFLSWPRNLIVLLKNNKKL